MLIIRIPCTSGAGEPLDQSKGSGLGMSRGKLELGSTVIQGSERKHALSGLALVTWPM